MLSVIISYFVNQNKQITINTTLQEIIPHQNTAIFAGYSHDGSIPDYVISYLKKLKEISPNIIYVTDNPIKNKEINKLRPFVNHLIAKHHNEYDWGSYKRGFNWLRTNDYLKNINNLILANDSTIPVADSFNHIIEDMKIKNPDFYGITANQDGIYHLQSYFLIITPRMYNNPDFSSYLNGVKQEQDGLTVAYRYEVPFTQYFEDKGYKSATYIPYEKLQHLPLNDKNCYPLTLLSQHKIPLLKMRTFTNRLNVQEPRRLVFNWLKKNAPQTHEELIKHLKNINSPYLNENR
jgi:lipopolysaccharide biosynthesis protein